MITFWSHLGLMYNDFLLRLYSERRRLGVFFSPEIRGSGEAQSRDFGIENSTGIPRDSNLVQLGRIHHTVSGLSWRHLYAFEQAMAEVWAAELGLAGGAWSTSASAVVWAKVFRLITSKVYEGFSGLVARAKSRRRHRTSCETPVPDQMPRNSPDGTSARPGSCP